MNATCISSDIVESTPDVTSTCVYPLPDQTSQLSSSDVDAQTDSFIIDSTRLTREYVSSQVANPSKTLVSATARAKFVDAVLGDISLAKHADTDPPLMRQLESRVTVLIDEASQIIKSPHYHVDVDALVAVLALVSARWPILVDTMERHGVVCLIVSAMREWYHRAAIVARCMTALRLLSVTNGVRKRVMVDGGVIVTLDLMDRYRKDARIQMRGAAVIANVAFGCTHRKRRIARQGGLKAVIDGMKLFPYDENIQLRGAITVRNLTHETQVNQFIAGNEGAVETICSALIRFRSSNNKPELRFHCVMALESLCREDERNRLRVVDFDNAGLSLLKRFSMDSDRISKQSDDGKERLNEDGDVVVDEEEILLPHVTANFQHGEALVPGHVIKRLETCTSLSSSGCSERLTQVKSSTTTTTTKPDADDGTDDPLKCSSGKPSLIRAIVHSIRRDPDDQLLVETALSLLTLVSMHRHEVQMRIGQVGGVQVAIASMRRHSHHSGIVSKAGALIRGLCFHDMNRGLVTSGLVVLIGATRDHRNDPEIVREIVSALSNAVFEHEKNRAWVVNKGGIDAVVQCIMGMMTASQRGGENRGGNVGDGESGCCDLMVVEAGICALRNFVDSSESGALCAVNEGAIRACLFVLEYISGGGTISSSAGGGTKHREGKSKSKSSKPSKRKSVMHCFVEEQCVLFLADLLRLVPAARDEMRELGLAALVRRVLSDLSHDEYPQVHRCGNQLLHALTQSSSRYYLHVGNSNSNSNGKGGRGGGNGTNGGAQSNCGVMPERAPPPPPPSCIIGRPFSKGLLGALAAGKRGSGSTASKQQMTTGEPPPPPSQAQPQPRKRSMFGSLISGRLSTVSPPSPDTKRVVRISVRFRRNHAVP